MTNDDWGVFPELTVGQNEEIKAARDAGFAVTFNSYTDPDSRTLAGARAFMKEKEHA